MKYRVKKDGECYIVQRKWLFFWIIGVYEEFLGYECYYKCYIKFDTYLDAIKGMDKDRLRRIDEKVNKYKDRMEKKYNYVIGGR